MSSTVTPLGHYQYINDIRVFTCPESSRRQAELDAWIAATVGWHHVHPFRYNSGFCGNELLTGTDLGHYTWESAGQRRARLQSCPIPPVETMVLADGLHFADYTDMNASVVPGIADSLSASAAHRQGTRAVGVYADQHGEAAELFNITWVVPPDYFGWLPSYLP